MRNYVTVAIASNYDLHHSTAWLLLRTPVVLATLQPLPKGDALELVVSVSLLSTRLVYVSGRAEEISGEQVPILCQ